MIPKACDISEFIERTEGKEVVCWGAGYWLNHLTDTYNCNIENTFSYVIDQNSQLWGTKKKVGSRELEIYSPQRLYDDLSERTVLLITFENFMSLFEALSVNTKFDNIECYASRAIDAYESDKHTYSAIQIPEGFLMNETPQIPKLIHYIWFGGKPLPDKFKVYIESWHKFCPDYEIKEWNETNYDIESHPFMRETMAANRPGFTSDYARLDIVYRYGGVYLDVDVELIRNIDDLLYCSAFCGFETAEYIALGLGFGARKNHPMIKSIRDVYDQTTFAEMASPDSPIKYIPCPVYQTGSMLKFGLKQNGRFQIVKDTAVFPAVYFNPLSNRTHRCFANDKTYSIHHFAASWLTENELKKRNYGNSWNNVFK